MYPFSARRSSLRPLNDCSGLQEIHRLSALNDKMNCHCEKSLILKQSSLEFVNFDFNKNIKLTDSVSSTE